MLRKTILAGCLALAALCPFLRAQLDPEKALASMQPADGLDVTLFAAEPDLINPTCIDVDPKGRVWVCEGVNYRAKAHPPFRKAGDRIILLEDTDGDGRSDRSTVFYQAPDIESPLGICYFGDRIFVSQSPRIFTLEIRPDGSAGERRDFLTGFGGVNHDHGVHSVLLGPDGLLYCAFGNEGAHVMDHSGGRMDSNGKPYFGGMVFRTSIEGTGSEVLAHNFRNNYECALDSFGTIWQSDNDDDGNRWVRFVYVMPGGNYGYLGSTGRHWGQEQKSHWHMEDPGVVPTLLRTGAGSPTGLCVYEGELLPERYRGMPIHADAGPRVVQCFQVRPFGAGYRVEGAPLDKDGHQTIATLSEIVQPEVLLTSTDSFFRPSDVCVAPDGSLFISDWYDPGVGGHGMGDTSRGRIYRLTPKGHQGYKVPALDLSSEKGLVDALSSPALSSRTLATLEIIGKGPKALPLLQGLAKSTNPVLRARALWLLGRLQDGRNELEKALSDGDPRFRVLAVRCLKLFAPREIVKLTRPLLDDTDPQVRREILLALRDVEGNEALSSILRLASHYDGQDRWYLEAIGIACRGREREAFQALLASWGNKWTLSESNILWELHPPEAAAFLLARLNEKGADEVEKKEVVRTLAELDGPAGGQALIQLLASGSPADLRKEAAALIEKGVSLRWAALRESNELRSGAAKLLTTPGLEEAGARLAAAATIGSLRMELEALAQGAKSEGARIEAIRALGAINEPVLVTLARKAAPEAEEALSALGRLSGSEPQEALRELLVNGSSPELRALALKSLGSTKSGAILLLHMAQGGDLPEAAKALATTVVHSSAYEDVRLMAEKILPQPKSSGGKELPPISELVQRQGDAPHGKKVFFDEQKANCGRCHRVGGRGSDVGPDLSTIGAKLGREGLLEAILSPSTAISPEYKVWILQTRTAGFVTGYIVEDASDHVTLRDANGKSFSFAKDDVLSRSPSDASLMPEGLQGAMTVKDLVDIVDFLSQQKQAGKAGGS